MARVAFGEEGTDSMSDVKSEGPVGNHTPERQVLWTDEFVRVVSAEGLL